MDANEFYNHWKEICKAEVDNLHQHWSIKKLYTNIIENDINGIIKQIASKLGLRYYREYYKLDAVFYNDNDKVPEIEHNGKYFPKRNETWLRQIQIAFEHENDFYDCYKEISHLAITNANLRVLVSYPEYEIKDELEWFHNIISANKEIKDNSFLLILGWKSKTKKIEWVGYSYNSKKWDEITNDQLILI